MTNDDTCALTGRQCVRTRYFKSRCSESPTLEQAAACIADIDEINIELELEVSAMDEWVDQLRTTPSGS